MNIRESVNAVRMAVADFTFEWRLSACLVLALAAVLAPLLVLFGLKYGIVEAIRAPMVENPAYRQLSPIGAGTFTRTWFEQLRADPAIAFIVPRTRTISATVRLRNSDANVRANLTAELIPTAVGDPAIGSTVATAPDSTHVVLSAQAGRKLKVAAGDTVQAIVTRTRNGRRERVNLPLKVVGIASEQAFARAGLFAQVSLLEAVENYRDGLGVKQFSWPGAVPGNAAARQFASYRLYAKTLADVAPLRARLEAIGLNVSTRANDIAVLQSLDRNLTLIFWIIAGIGALGYLLSLGASLWSLVERKRKELSVLRLVGMRVSALVWFPVAHAVMLGVVGSTVAVGAALAISELLNTLFADAGAAGQFVCALQADHLLVAAAITLVGAIFASSLAAIRSMQIDPAEGLRDV
jgi:putative ABC transport system permease protein